MSDDILIEKLIARALLDIRIAASEGNSDICFALSDLFHNIPLQIIKAKDNPGSYPDILDWLKMRAEQKKILGWLNNAIIESQK